MSDRALTEWVKSGEHLPEFMRDFHDQKRLFKRIDESVTPQRREFVPDWVSAQIYVIDFFLWFMARRGYTLQKSHKILEFVDLKSDLEDFDRRQIEMFKQEYSP